MESHRFNIPVEHLVIISDIARSGWPVLELINIIEARPDDKDDLGHLQRDVYIFRDRSRPWLCNHAFTLNLN